ncbi:MAG: glycosyltransferase family 4 protein [Chloroflexi bacterium]|nr:glycosyltransferase family 4 protein [Chloroflexota bacterium]
MRIAQLSPLWERVPPPAYGGTEGVVHLLTEGLVRRGHEVTLFASGDSVTSARLRSVLPSSLRTASFIQDSRPYEWVHVAEALQEAGSFDIIHNHSGELPMVVSSLFTTPMLSTMHCIITPDTKVVWDSYRGYYNTISWAERKSMPTIRNSNFVGVVYNGIDVSSFPYRADKEDYLLYLGRVAPEKGTHLAIDAAKRLGKKLLIAGKVDRVDRDYFIREVDPLIDGKLIHFLGEANAQWKRELCARASVVLMPIVWEEPFGLVMVEAMACGTPVISFNRGAAAELIADGETGYLVADVDGMVEAVRRLDSIDPSRCRQHVADHFDAARMVDGYVEVYERILASG